MTDSVIVKAHHSCDECGSSDAASTYSDGHTYCFSCGHVSGGIRNKEAKRVEGLIDTEYKDIQARGISEATARKYGYGFGTCNRAGGRVHVANYQRKGAITSQHLRSKNKDFTWLNHNPGVELFGQHLWESGGKQLIITEGEIDCLSWAEVRSCKWPVVGLPGVSSIKMVKLHRQWIASFDEVVLYFDMDDAGKAFASEVAAILSPTVVRIGNTAPYKDSNEMLLNAGSTALFSTLYQAKTWQPETLVSHEEAINLPEAERTINLGVEPFDTLTGGLAEGNLVMIGAGSNIGKSMLIRHLAHSAAQSERIGYFPLEEGVARVSKSISDIGHVPEGNITYFKDTGTDLSDNVMSTIEYLSVSGVRLFFVDHITSVINQTLKDVSAIDEFLQRMQSLAVRLGCVVIYNSHVKDPDRGSYETGQLPTSSSFRGSGMLYRIPDVVLVLGRAITDEDTKHITTLMCLKHRDDGLRVGELVEYTLKDNRLIVVDTADEIDLTGDF